MSLPFDARLKNLVQMRPEDLAHALRLHEPQPVQVLNVDLSTITAATDVALGFGEPLVCIYDVNFQASYDGGLAGRLLLYNVLLHHRFGVPVHTVVVLLRPAADHSALTGHVKYRTRRRGGKMDYTFEIVRLWQLPVRSILKGGLGMLPLAPLCRQAGDLALDDALPPLLRQLKERLNRETTPEDAAKLFSATYVLTGLVLPRDRVDDFFRGERIMMESSTYRGLIEDGELAGSKKMLFRQGRVRFGPPNEAIEASLEAIKDFERLQRMGERLLTVSGWQELLDTP